VPLLREARGADLARRPARHALAGPGKRPGRVASAAASDAPPAAVSGEHRAVPPLRDVLAAVRVPVLATAVVVPSPGGVERRQGAGAARPRAC
jgi:hypothetical protein